MKIDFHLLRNITAVCLAICFFIFSQHLELWLISSVIFVAVFKIPLEWHKITQFINKHSFIMKMLSTVICFFISIYAARHFNDKYGILPENIKHSIAVLTVIWGIMFIISILCVALVFRFGIQMNKNELKQPKDWVKMAELFVCSFACLQISMWILPVSQTINNHDKVLLRLDAYQHSDCQTPENEVAIRKNDNICYSFSPTGIVNWELKEYPRNKH